MAADPLLEPLRSDPSAAAILCDIDGTLAPIVDDPEAAAVPAEARAVLADLAGRYALVACVSGRRASAARRMVGLDELTYAGNHGLELLSPGDERPRLDPGARPSRRGRGRVRLAPRLARLAAGRPAPRGQGSDPGDPLARRAGSRGRPPQRAQEIGDARRGGGAGRRISAGWCSSSGRWRPSTRGSRSAGWSTRPAAAAALFGGDDRTDLDAFAALRELSASGRARATPSASGSPPPRGRRRSQRDADLVVDGPAGFLDLLRDL